MRIDLNSLILADGNQIKDYNSLNKYSINIGIEQGLNYIINQNQPYFKSATKGTHGENFGKSSY